MLHIFRLGMRVLPWLPQWLIDLACAGLGWLVLGLFGSVRRGVLLNLAHIQPNLAIWRRVLLAQHVIANVGRHYADLLRLPAFDAGELERRCEFTGTEYLDALLAQGNGGMIAAPHSGPFSPAMALLAERGYPLVLVAEQLHPPELMELISSMRRRPNLEIVPLGPTAGRDVLRALRANKLVVLAGDRDLAAQNVRLPFFGAATNVPSGIARLALRGTPLLTSYSAWLAGDRALARIDSLEHVAVLPGESREAAAERVTLAYLQRFEDYIGRFPASWGVLQPNWPASPDEVSSV